MYKLLNNKNGLYWKGGFRGYTKYGKTWSSKKAIKLAIINHWLYRNTGLDWKKLKEEFDSYDLIVENIVAKEKFSFVEFIEAEILGNSSYFVCDICGRLERNPIKLPPALKDDRKICRKCFWDIEENKK